MERKTIVINFYAGPGAGKTTSALALAHKLKHEGYTCEFASEFAKELVYAGEIEKLKDQEYVTGEQMRRIGLYRGKVDFIVTDSPVLLGLVYGPDNSAAFSDKLLQFYESFINLNFYVTRSKPYKRVGRIQTEAEAKEKDMEIRDVLEKYGLPFEVIEYGCPSGESRMLEWCKKEFSIIGGCV